MNFAVQTRALTAASRALAVLTQAGLPVGGVVRAGPAPSPGEMAAAARALLSMSDSPEAVEPWIHEAIGAFLLGWFHEWPGSFTAAFEEDQRDVVRWARAHTSDPGRYVKLRRIAIANLASHL